MKKIASAFALWFSLHGLSPSDPSVCTLKGVHAAGAKGHYWGCYRCHVPVYWHERLRVFIGPYTYLGTILMRCQGKWCKVVTPLPKWSWKTAGTCEIEGAKKK